MIAALLLLGCGTPSPESPPVEPKPAPTRRVVIDAEDPESDADGVKTDAGGARVDAGDATTEAVSIELQFVGVGGLHQRWFSDRAIVTDLAQSLATCMTGRAVIELSYDEEERIGRIKLLLSGDQVVCKPVKTGASVDASALVPLNTALTGYRDAVAGRFDFRVASFRIEHEVVSGTKGCALHVGGQHPPDGTTFAPCVTLGGEEACAKDPEDDGVSTFTFRTPQHASYLAQCFDD